MACISLLVSGKDNLQPVDQETFKELLKLCISTVIMLTNDGYFHQVFGLAM